jgi:hypothetical protein
MYKFDLVLQKGPREKFGEVWLDVRPDPAGTIQYQGELWRVVDYVWGPQLVNDTTMSSGLICVEKLK